MFVVIDVEKSGVENMKNVYDAAGSTVVPEGPKGREIWIWLTSRPSSIVTRFAYVLPCSMSLQPSKRSLRESSAPQALLPHETRCVRIGGLRQIGQADTWRRQFLQRTMCPQGSRNSVNVPS